MEQIKQLIQSYFYFRGAVLRKLEDYRFSKADYKAIFGQDSNSIYRRRNNGSLWKPTEIHNLALRMGLWDGRVSRLQNLASLIEQLPGPEKKAICKVAGLTDEKLQQHVHDPDSWWPKELEKIQLWCSQKRSATSKK
ncbi:hypothetical protein WBJ53_29625 [Spirosoma sp. SC4-14]|uniref:hypothetical protein n=1 Tax=Spirosoma sp. SC4-14 TaxID=3128900 RepID=UPI0030D337C1